MKSAPKITEKSIMLGIMGMLGMHGWRVLRVPPSIYGTKGWSDLIAIKDGRVLFIECKSAKGKLSPDQRHFGQLISDAGGTYVVARSVDFVAGIIRETKGGDG